MQQRTFLADSDIIITPSGLELKVLDTAIPYSDISSCVGAHNPEWEKFFELTPQIKKQRLHSGELSLGGYEQGTLVTYLETQSHYVEIPDMPANPDEPEVERARRIANFVSGQLGGNYFEYAPGGMFPDRPKNANVIRFMSINTLPNRRDQGYGGQLIEYIKLLMSMPREERPKQLRDVVVGLTDTPVKTLPQRFHTEHQAFRTAPRIQDFRPGYDEPDIIRFCYFAPGFLAPLGRILSA